MQRNSITRRGRTKARDHLTHRDRRLHWLAGLTIFLLLGLEAMAEIDRNQKLSFTSGKIGNAQSIALSHFSHERGYVRYQIKRSGRYNWFGSISERFQVVGGWRRIAQMTLEVGGKKASTKEIDELQYRVDLGKEVWIPLS